MAKITWLGHACWLLESDGVRAIIDPFLTGNPQAACPLPMCNPIWCWFRMGMATTAATPPRSPTAAEQH